MALDAMNQFWKESASNGIDIDVGASFADGIAKGFWIDYHKDIHANAPPPGLPKTYELREVRIERTILFWSGSSSEPASSTRRSAKPRSYKTRSARASVSEGRFFCRTTTELAYVAVPRSVPFS